MKKLVIILLMSLMILSLNAKFSDKILAKAGKDIILSSDVVKQINQMKSAQMWRNDYTVEDVLNDMIDSKIIIQKAKELNLTVEEIKIKNIIEKQIDQIRSQFSNEETFYSELKKANITLSELKKYYENMLTEQQLKEQVINTYIKSKIKISDAEVKEFYDLHKDSLNTGEKKYDTYLILRNTKISDKTKKDAYQKILSVQELLKKKGETFESVAKKMSQCPSGENGGDLGYFKKGDMLKSFEDAAFSLKKGETSGIVETSFGYHLIKVYDIKGDEIKASHILIKTDPTPADLENEKSLLENVKNQIKNGASFEDLAVQYSEEETVKETRGLIGTFAKNEFPELFADVLSQLNNQEVSEVIQNEQTFYLFYIKEVKTQTASGFDELKPKIKEMIMFQKQSQIYKQWIEQTRKEMYVKIYQERVNELSQEFK